MTRLERQHFRNAVARRICSLRGLEHRVILTWPRETSTIGEVRFKSCVNSYSVYVLVAASCAAWSFVGDTN